MMKDKPKYPSYIYIYRQPDLTDLLNKPSKDATNSNSIRELTSKLEKVEKVLQLKGGETSEKVSEEPISAKDKSALETTLVTDVVTNGGTANSASSENKEPAKPTNEDVGKRVSTVLMAKALGNGIKDKLASSIKSTKSKEVGNYQNRIPEIA